MRRRRYLVVLGPLLCLAGACGDDQSSAPDAATESDASPDAGVIDAGAPDAFDPCPGKSTFQVGVKDWASNQNLAGIAITEGGTANSVTSAPNGRVILCIPLTGTVNIHFSHANYLDRVHTTTGEIAADQYAAGQAPTFRLLSSAQADTLYSSAATGRVTTASTFIAMVREAADGSGLGSATPTIGATHGGAYVPGADVDTLTAGASTGADGRVLFLNTEVDPATTTVQITGPSNCAMPATVALAAGTSSVSIVCGP